MKKLNKVLILLMVVLIALSPLLYGTSAKANAKNPYISPWTVSINVGAIQKLSMKGLAKGSEVKWSSNNKKIATVSKWGTVTGVAEGKATITATVGKKKYTRVVTVKSTISPRFPDDGISASFIITPDDPEHIKLTITNNTKKTIGIGYFVSLLNVEKNKCTALIYREQSFDNYNYDHNIDDELIKSGETITLSLGDGYYDYVFDYYVDNDSKLIMGVAYDNNTYGVTVDAQGKVTVLQPQYSKAEYPKYFAAYGIMLIKKELENPDSLTINNIYYNANTIYLDYSTVNSNGESTPLQAYVTHDKAPVFLVYDYLYNKEFGYVMNYYFKGKFKGNTDGKQDLKVILTLVDQLEAKGDYEFYEMPEIRKSMMK